MLHWRCFFSVKTNLVIRRSPLGCRIWAVAVYQVLNGLKGVASTKLARNLGIKQKSAWHLGDRIHAAFANGEDRSLMGPVEIDDTYIGGEDRNHHAFERGGSRGVDSKWLVVGIWNRAMGHVHAKVVDDTKKDELEGHLKENDLSVPTVYSDQIATYDDFPQTHEAE